MRHLVINLLATGLPRNQHNITCQIAPDKPMVRRARLLFPSRKMTLPAKWPYIAASFDKSAKERRPVARRYLVKYSVNKAGEKIQTARNHCQRQQEVSKP
jgi:hypothetical protein